MVSVGVARAGRKVEAREAVEIKFLATTVVGMVEAAKARVDSEDAMAVESEVAARQGTVEEAKGTAVLAVGAVVVAWEAASPIRMLSYCTSATVDLSSCRMATTTKSRPTKQVSADRLRSCQPRSGSSRMPPRPCCQLLGTQHRGQVGVPRRR